mmetsp:Transcript_10139/g.30930  ORF Transcript_10139/g.30930 Transcript_10139/m.30930 type:complete len:217 (-) Transcript_10139:2235-2885(-)
MQISICSPSKIHQLSLALHLLLKGPSKTLPYHPSLTSSRVGVNTTSTSVAFVPFGTLTMALTSVLDWLQESLSLWSMLAQVVRCFLMSPLGVLSHTTLSSTPSSSFRVPVSSSNTSHFKHGFTMPPSSMPSDSLNPHPSALASVWPECWTALGSFFAAAALPLDDLLYDFFDPKKPCCKAAGRPDGGEAPSLVPSCEVAVLLTSEGLPLWETFPVK